MTNSMTPNSTPSTSTPSTTTTKQPRQGRVNLKPEMVKKLIPLPMIGQGEEILLELNRYRFMTNQQVADLLFRGKPNIRKQIFSMTGAKDAADLSLKRLFESSLIERKMVWQMTNPYNKPINDGETLLKPAMVRAPINILTREGAKVVETLMEDRGLDGADIRWTPKFHKLTDQNIAHELEITDAAIAFRRALADQAGMAQVVWLDDQQIQSLMRVHKITLGSLTPDGFSLVEYVGDGVSRFFPVFFEIDRQTETIRSSRGISKDWKAKIERYGLSFSHEAAMSHFYEALEFTPDEIKTFATPRVLTITTNAGRVQKMIEATRDAKGRGVYLYATKDDVYGTWGNILSAVWRTTLLGDTGRVSLLEQLKNG